MLPRLSDYAQRSLIAAGEHALRLHADEVTPEHWLGALISDEDSAANQLAIHAFADPETIAFELLALSPGIMVVGSHAALPFSTTAVQALREARQLALDERCEQVDAAALLDQAVAALPPEAQVKLQEAGFARSDAKPKPAPVDESKVLRSTGSLFQGFSDPAKRALSQANKDAFSAKESSISPARMALACLAAEPELESRYGTNRKQARLALSGHFVDETPLEPRLLAPSTELLAFLDILPPGAGSIEVLVATREEGDQELIALFDRHRMTSSLLARSMTAFQDPTTD